MRTHLYLFLGLLIVSHIVLVINEFAITTSILIGGISIWNGIQKYSTNFLTTHVYESCKYTLNNIKKHELLAYMKSSIYGQHIAIESIVNAIVGHLNDLTPKKPLVISLHGWTGNGKNYFTYLLLNKIYKNGFNSKFVHLFSGRIHFSKKDKVEDYKWDLFNWIKGNMSACKHSTFIIDEVDEIQAGVLDPLKAIFDYSIIDKGLHNKCIFIFISNVGGESITFRMLDLFKNGIKRESLTIKDFEHTLTEIAYEMNGGFRGSPIISSNLIDHYIPFLPMEPMHVKLCIKDAFRSFNVQEPSDLMINEVMDTIIWAPPPQKLFSETGCKRIREKANYVINKYRSYE